MAKAVSKAVKQFTSVIDGSLGKKLLGDAKDKLMGGKPPPTPEPDPLAKKTQGIGTRTSLLDRIGQKKARGKSGTGGSLFRGLLGGRY